MHTYALLVITLMMIRVVMIRILQNDLIYTYLLGPGPHCGKTNFLKAHNATLQLGLLRVSFMI